MGSDGIVKIFFARTIDTNGSGVIQPLVSMVFNGHGPRSNDAMVSMYRSPLRHSVVKIDAWISLSCFSDLSKLLSAFIKVVYVFLAFV